MTSTLKQKSIDQSEYYMIKIFSYNNANQPVGIFSVGTSVSGSRDRFVTAFGNAAEPFVFLEFEVRGSSTNILKACFVCCFV